MKFQNGEKELDNMSVGIRNKGSLNIRPFSNSVFDNQFKVRPQ